MWRWTPLSFSLTKIVFFLFRRLLFSLRQSLVLIFSWSLVIFLIILVISFPTLLIAIFLLLLCFTPSLFLMVPTLSLVIILTTVLHLPATIFLLSFITAMLVRGVFILSMIRSWTRAWFPFPFRLSGFILSVFILIMLGGMMPFVFLATISRPPPITSVFELEGHYWS